MKYYPTAIERMQMERPSEKRTKSQGQLIASWCRTDLMSQCGINITVQKKSLFHDIDFPCTPGGWGPNSSSYRVTCKRYCVRLRVEHSKIYISALPYINISRLRIHRLRKLQFPVDSVKFFTLSCLRREVWCVWVEF